MTQPRKPLEVSLTDNPGWMSWDLAGEIADSVSSLAAETFEAILSEGICDQLIMDLAGPIKQRRRSKQDWSGRTITWDDSERICMGLKAGEPGLELTRDAIFSIITEAYEEALTPSDRDITDTIDDAIEKMADNFEIDEDFWAPLLDAGADADEIIRGLFEHTAGGVFVDRHVAYRRTPGHYERNLVFDFWKSDVVKSFLKILPDDYDMTTTLNQLEKEFHVVVSGFLSRFFSILQKNISEIDVQNRVDWRRAWKDMIAGNRPPGGGGYEVGKEPTLDLIRKEMVAYLNETSTESPEVESDDDL